MSIAWSEYFEPGRLREFAALRPVDDPAQWARGDADGRGVRVAVVDSGIEAGHPLVGSVAGSVTFEPDETARFGFRVAPCAPGDLAGHGTACAGLVRAVAPACELWSVRVLGESSRGRAAILAAALEWVVQERFDVVNLSLSTANRDWAGPLHDLVDDAFFAGCVLVCAVNNVYKPTFPSQFASVVSVAVGGDADAPLSYNVDAPAEFGAPGLDVTVAWSGGGTATVSGNSFAAAHVSGLAALVRGAHPGLAPHGVKALLAATCVNARPSQAPPVSAR